MRDSGVTDEFLFEGTSKSESQKTSSPSRHRRRRRSPTSPEEWVESRPEPVVDSPSPTPDQRSGTLQALPADSSPSASTKRDRQQKDDKPNERSELTTQPIHTSQQPTIVSTKSKWDDDEGSMATESPQVPEETPIQPAA